MFSGIPYSQAFLEAQRIGAREREKAQLRRKMAAERRLFADELRQACKAPGTLAITLSLDTVMRLARMLEDQ